MGEETRVFDSFECAIHLLAPVCANCGIKVIGHGLQIRGRVFCSSHCSRSAGVRYFQDRLSP